MLPLPPQTEANLPMISFPWPTTNPPKLEKLCRLPTTTLCEPVRVFGLPLRFSLYPTKRLPSPFTVCVCPAPFTTRRLAPDIRITGRPDGSRNVVRYLSFCLQCCHPLLQRQGEPADRFVLRLCDGARQRPTDKAQHQQQHGGAPPPAQLSCDRARLVVQGLDLVFEGFEAFEQVIHGGRSSLWPTEASDKQSKTRKWRECMRVGGGCQLWSGANGVTRQRHSTRANLTLIGKDKV